MNSKYLQTKFIKHLQRKGFHVFLENLYLYKKESDILAIKSGLVYEFEFKIGEADFRKDLSKGRHSSNMEKPNFFFYVVPDFLVFEIQKHLFPEYGLIIAKETKDNFIIFKWVIPAKRLKKTKISNEELTYLLSIFTRKVYG